MKEKINDQIAKYLDELAEMFVEDLRRVLSTGTSSQELVRLFLEESVNVSIASLTKTDKRIHSAVFTKVNDILSKKEFMLNLRERVDLIVEFHLLEIILQKHDGSTLEIVSLC